MTEPISFGSAARRTASLRWRPQRAVGPLAGCRVVQRVVVAIGADVARPPLGGIVGHRSHRLAARRARLPDRIGRNHLNSPLPPELSSAAGGLKRVAENCW